MLNRLAPVAAFILLSGCTLTNGEQYQKQMLDALKQSESRISNQIENLQLATSTQSDYISGLENEVAALREQLTQYKHQASELAKENKPVVAPVPIKISEPTQETKLANGEIVLGAIEKVRLADIKQSFDARVDTGATTSSLNAADLESFERDGKDWVRFHLTDPEHPATKQNWIEAPIVRYVKIRQSTSDKVERRPVVELWVQLGSIREKAQFTLANRSQMTFPVLLGREFIRDIAVVDVSKNYIQSGNIK